MHRIVTALFLVLPFAVLAAPRTCQVVGIADGDTFTARCGAAGAYQQIKVRFIAIDAPDRSQPFGTRAKEALSDLILDKTVDLECGRTDPYGRSVCKVSFAPSSNPRGPRIEDAGLTMVSLGMAWWHRSHAAEQAPQDRGLYERAEAEARARRVGLWGDAAPVAPWAWRKAAQEAQ